MSIVLMKTKTDCEVAAIATATGKTYEESLDALNWQSLKGFENPIYGNPFNLYRSLIALGFWKKNITLNDLIEKKAEPINTVILIHNQKNPTLSQHWVNYAGLNSSGMVGIYNGKHPVPVFCNKERFKDLFLKGWPNCAFQVYKASVFRLYYERLKAWMERLKNSLKKLLKKTEFKDRNYLQLEKLNDKLKYLNKKTKKRGL